MDEERDGVELVRKAIAAGRIEIDARVAESIEAMDLFNPDHVTDFTVTGTELSCWSANRQGNPGFSVRWFTKSAGCGHVDFWIEDGRVRCYREGMGAEFIVSVLRHVIENAEVAD